MELELEIQKTNVGIKITILEILYVPIFRQNKHFLLFRPKFPQKLILGSEFQKQCLQDSESESVQVQNQHLQDSMCSNV